MLMGDPLPDPRRWRAGGLRFLFTLREAGVPVFSAEYLALMAAMAAGVAGMGIDTYCTYIRCSLIKDECHLGRHRMRAVRSGPGLVD